MNLAEELKEVALDAQIKQEAERTDRNSLAGILAKIKAIAKKGHMVYESDLMPHTDACKRKKELKEMGFKVQLFKDNDRDAPFPQSIINVNWK